MRLEVRIVDLLCASGELRSELSKRMLVERTARCAGYPLQVVEHPIARQWLLGLVDECARSLSLGALLHAVQALAPDTPLYTELARLVDEWDGAETEALAPTVGGGEQTGSDAALAWPALKDELSRLDRVDVGVAYRLATGDRELAPPPHCVTAWQVFVHLAGRGAGPSGLPPFMIFLEHLALSDVLSPDAERLADMWNRRLAVELGLAAELDDVRRGRADAARARSPIHLVIQFEPAGAGGDRFHVSWWRQWFSSTRNVTQDGRREHVKRCDLELAVGGVVVATERSLADDSGDLVLEFVLPFELIDVPVEWWLKPETYGPPKPLAMDYSVTLRSLERMYLPEWRRVWRDRWRHVELPSARVTHWSTPTGPGHAARLEAQLRADERLVALVLSEPPASGGPGMDEVVVALRSGLPGVIWCRSAGERSRDVEDALRGYVVEGRAVDLPTRVHRLRLAAQQLEPERQNGHVGRQLALLWDDPDLCPGGRPAYTLLRGRGEIGP